MQEKQNIKCCEIITMKLMDYSGSEYILVQIEEDGFEEFKQMLKEYQKAKDYNLDDFLSLIQEKTWYSCEISSDYDINF